MTQQKERQLQINQPNFPLGSPSALLPSVPAAACLGTIPHRSHHAPAARVGSLWLSQSGTSAVCLQMHVCKGESFHLGWRQPAELPVQQMPFSSKTTCCSSPAPYHMDSSITDFKTWEATCHIFNALLTPQKFSLTQEGLFGKEAYFQSNKYAGSLNHKRG